MSNEYLMNTASILFFICYIPEFYANYINKNANTYNVFEKVIIFIATSFSLSYSISINNNALIFNYGPLLVLDFIALFMRSYYAYKNRYRNVRVLTNTSNNYNNNYNNYNNNNNIEIHDIENPLHNIDANL
jgi:uncharacterized protein with PQ loop repeat